MKRSVLLLSLGLLLFATTVSHAFTPAHLWSQRFGSTGTDAGHTIAVDGLGNVYVAGPFQATVNFGGANLVSAGAVDIFLAKYNANGLHEWSKSFGSTLSDNVRSISVDASGNIYMTGDFGGTVSFGGAGLISAGQADMFLAKYSSIGVHQWSFRYGSTTEDGGDDVAVTPAGDVFVTGNFQGTVSFGGAGLISAGNSDIFLVKYNTSGAHQWSHRFGSTLADFGQSLDVDGAGDVIAMGSFAGTVNFGGGNLIAAGQLDISLIKYNSAGVHQWSKRFGAAENDYSSAVDTDESGNIYLMGYYHETVDFGGGGLTSYGNEDVFLAKYDAAGNHQWSRHYGGTGVELGAGVAVDETSIFTTGYFNGNATFGGSTLSSAGTSDVFLAKYSRVHAEPFMTSIEDVLNDQGGKVKIFFARSGGDDASASNPVTHYVALRRDDPPPTGASDPLATAPADPSLLAGWIEVGSVDAFNEDEYGIVVPTVGDSTISNGQYWSVFMIRAATGIPSVHFTSPPDSGYSLDNLAPGAPTNLVLVGSQLHWSGSPAADFDYFTVYGGFSGNFGVAHVIGYTEGTTQSALGSTYPFYFVTATDFAGNESLPASTATATGVGDGPTQFVLSVTNYPNPFNPATRVRYTVPARGAVTIGVYDAGGARVATLIEGREHDAGAYHVDWDGRSHRGRAVSSGVYFVRIEHNGDARTKKMVMLK